MITVGRSTSCHRLSQVLFKGGEVLSSVSARVASASARVPGDLPLLPHPAAGHAEGPDGQRDKAVETDRSLELGVLRGDGGMSVNCRGTPTCPEFDVIHREIRKWGVREESGGHLQNRPQVYGDAARSAVRHLPRPGVRGDSGLSGNFGFRQSATHPGDLDTIVAEAEWGYTPVTRCRSSCVSSES